MSSFVAWHNVCGFKLQFNVTVVSRRDQSDSTFPSRPGNTNISIRHSFHLNSLFCPNITFRKFHQQFLIKTSIKPFENSTTLNHIFFKYQQNVQYHISRLPFPIIELLISNYNVTDQSFRLLIKLYIFIYTIIVIFLQECVIHKYLNIRNIRIQVWRHHPHHQILSSRSLVRLK